MPPKFPERVRPLGNRVAVKMNAPSDAGSDTELQTADDPVSGIVVLLGTGVNSDVCDGNTVYFSYFDAVPIETAQGVVHVVAVDKLLAKVV